MNAAAARRRESPIGIVNFLSKSNFPSLNAYIALSLVITLIATGTIATAFHSQPELRTLIKEELRNHTRLSKTFGLDLEYLSTLTSFQVVHYVLSDSTLIWVAINSYFAFLAIISKLMIRVVFKELSRQEEALARHAFFSYTLLSIVYLSVITGPQKSQRVLPWMVWTGICGFISNLQFITCQRLRYISPSCGQGGLKMSFLSLVIFFISLLMSILVLRFHSLISWQPAILLYIDCLLAIVRSSYILFRCISSSRVFSFNPDSVRYFNYWLELGSNITCDFLQMINYAQLLLVSPGFNLTCLFFLYHIKLSYHLIADQLSRHRGHKRIFAHIEATYPCVKCENSDDRCVVCWELLGQSRRLPCSHQFHDWCLMWWMAQDSSCPTCRTVIPSPLDEPSTAAAATPAAAAERNDSNVTFRFNGGNFAFVRLPAFTIEISTGLGPLFGRAPEPTEEQLQAMLEQVREVVPQTSTELIMADLRASGSAQSTIENILEGRVGFGGTNQLLPDVLDSEELDSEADGEFDESIDSTISTLDDRERTWTKGEPTEEMTYFELQRQKMIEKYRKKYLASSKGADLRAKGIVE
ncbi:unnamed protein product [Caenorhabditis bovis]|uniref:RING-type domain-containing protein n=1 Tax=Caenorhabditis bovis TaxID=2654633 RepID=A0A8S1EVQ7_9PELO|nr:unnamed protein product [Caenorhabditis bovis]